MNREAIISTLIDIIADTYGFDPETLNAKSHLIEDIDLKGNMDEFIRFLQRVNEEFEIELTASDIVISHNPAVGIQTIGELALIVDDAQLG